MPRWQLKAFAVEQQHRTPPAVAAICILSASTCTNPYLSPMALLALLQLWSYRCQWESLLIHNSVFISLKLGPSKATNIQGLPPSSPVLGPAASERAAGMKYCGKGLPAQSCFLWCANQSRTGFSRIRNCSAALEISSLGFWSPGLRSYLSPLFPPHGTLHCKSEAMLQQNGPAVICRRSYSWALPHWSMRAQVISLGACIQREQGTYTWAQLALTQMQCLSASICGTCSPNACKRSSLPAQEEAHMSVSTDVGTRCMCPRVIVKLVRNS